MEKNKVENKSENNCILLVLVYVLLIINYRFVISKYYIYQGFNQKYFSVAKLLISFSFTIVLIILYKLIKKEFYKIVYNIYLVMIFFGQSIFYIFNQSNFIIVIYMAIPLIILFILQKFDKEKNSNDIKLKLSDKFTWFIFITIALLMIAPYFKNYKLINFRNLLLKDIYTTRSMQSGQLSGILGYLFSPISRVILPFIFIYSLENKKKMTIILSVVYLVMMYLLNGALKSIFFGLLACIFFYKGEYFQKEKYFLKYMIVGNLLSLLEPFIMDSYFIADYMRRIFFVPAILFEAYYKYFKGQPTYFLHSRISKILGIQEFHEWIPHYIGEYVLGKKGLSANVGIFAEGFVSFGTIGVIISSIIFAYIIRYLNRRRLSPAYFGILFSYIYVINTSFIETLFITHGLLFYLIFARYVIPKETINN